MTNFYDKAQQILDNASGKKLLLHSCCAPCSSSVLERLIPQIDVTVFYYNPCIMPSEEYEHRLSEQKRLCEIMNVPLIVGEYDNARYVECVRGYEGAPEGGDRCKKCFYMRLYETAQKAKSEGCDYFCTTLTVSPHKNAEIINAIGEQIASEVGIAFLPSDFKKKNGYLRSIELSKQYGIYRQGYCGCRF